MNEAEKERLERKALTKTYFEALAKAEKAAAAYKRQLQQAGLPVDNDVDSYVPADEANQLRARLAEAETALTMERGRFASLSEKFADALESLREEKEEASKGWQAAANATAARNALQAQFADCEKLLKRLADGPRAIGRNARVINAMLDEAWGYLNKK